jgi:hypothetical protein
MKPPKVHSVLMHSVLVLLALSLHADWQLSSEKNISDSAVVKQKAILLSTI